MFKKKRNIHEVVAKLEANINREFIKAKFAEVNDSIKYVATVDTHEIVYMNDSLLKLVGKDWEQKKCHEVLQDFPVPCGFCTNSRLVEGKVIQWIHRNEKLGKVFWVRDFLIVVDGRRLRYENAIEISSDLVKQITEINH